jgi:hypothetical protein
LPALRTFVSAPYDQRPRNKIQDRDFIAARKRAAQQQRAMNAEHDHCLKDVLATIDARRRYAHGKLLRVKGGTRDIARVPK